MMGKRKSRFGFCGVVMALVMGVLLCAASGTAAVSNGNVFNDLQPFVAVYNEQIVDDLPPFVEKLVANQRINAIVYCYDYGGYNPYVVEFGGKSFACYGSVVIGVVTDADVAIVEFTQGEIDNPTMQMAMYDSVIYSAMQAENPLCDLITAKNNGWLAISGVGIIQKAKVATIDALVASFGRLKCGLAG